MNIDTSTLIGRPFSGINTTTATAAIANTAAQQPTLNHQIVVKLPPVLGCISKVRLRKDLAPPIASDNQLYNVITYKSNKNNHILSSKPFNKVQESLNKMKCRVVDAIDDNTYNYMSTLRDSLSDIDSQSTFSADKSGVGSNHLAVAYDQMDSYVTNNSKRIHTNTNTTTTSTIGLQLHSSSDVQDYAAPSIDIKMTCTNSVKVNKEIPRNYEYHAISSNSSNRNSIDTLSVATPPIMFDIKPPYKKYSSATNDINNDTSNSAQSIGDGKLSNAPINDNISDLMRDPAYTIRQGDVNLDLYRVRVPSSKSAHRIDPDAINTEPIYHPATFRVESREKSSKTSRRGSSSNNNNNSDDTGLIGTDEGYENSISMNIKDSIDTIPVELTPLWPEVDLIEEKTAAHDLYKSKYMNAERIEWMALPEQLDLDDEYRLMQKANATPFDNSAGLVCVRTMRFERKVYQDYPGHSNTIYMSSKGSIKDASSHSSSSDDRMQMNTFKHHYQPTNNMKGMNKDISMYQQLLKSQSNVQLHAKVVSYEKPKEQLNLTAAQRTMMNAEKMNEIALKEKLKRSNSSASDKRKKSKKKNKKKGKDSNNDVVIPVAYCITGGNKVSVSSSSIPLESAYTPLYGITKTLSFPVDSVSANRNKLIDREITIHNKIPVYTKASLSSSL